MGQAFDRDGALMGEAFGATKREVFDTLMERHPDSEEIRIKTIHAAAQISDATQLLQQESRGGLPGSPLKAERMWAYFAFAHLPQPLQDVSRPFCDLAQQIIMTQPPTPERTVCLRKLLEAKDCAVRNMLGQKEP